MIRMRMSVEHPAHGQVIVAHDIEDLIHAPGGKAIILGIEIPYHVDQCGFAGFRIGANILYGTCVRLIYAPDIGTALSCRG